MAAGSISRYTAPTSPTGSTAGVAGAVGAPPYITSAAAAPIAGPMLPLSSLGPVGIRDARPRPSPVRLGGGVMLFSYSCGRSLANLRIRRTMCAVGDLTTGVEIAHRAPRPWVVLEDRHAVARCLGHLHAARDDGSEDLRAEVRPH